MSSRYTKVTWKCPLCGKRHIWEDETSQIGMLMSLTCVGSGGCFKMTTGRFIALKEFSHKYLLPRTI